MVKYLPSSATTSITVLALEVNTTLTISAPSSVVQGASFNISGILIRDDTGGPIPNASIVIYHNGSAIASGSTGVDGDYLVTGSIPDIGTFTLTADFSGMEVPGLRFMPSLARTPITTPGIPEITPYLGPIAVGLAILGAYIIAKRR